MELRSFLENNTLVVLLPEKIDTSNCQDFEDSLNKIIAEREDFSKLILDLKNLIYISSVGLRSVLRLKQKFDDLTLINASSDVYDIFSMTGFTEIIKIEKVFREVSIEGCVVIGQGYYGKVYRISPDTIIKVYKMRGDIDNIRRERNLAQKAFVLGIPTAISYDVVRVKEGGYGIIFELINADSFLKVIKENPDKFDTYIEMYANLLNKIASTKINDDSLPSAKNNLKLWVNTIKGHFNDEELKDINRLVETLPDSDNMIHGDCHAKNIFIVDNEPVLIDMDTLAKGHRIFDFAAIYQTYIAYEASEPGNLERFLGISKETGYKLFHNTLRTIYPTLSEEEYNLIVKKISFVGYVQLLNAVENGGAPLAERIAMCENGIKSLAKELDTLDF